MPAILTTHVAVQPDREVFRRDPGLPDHLGHLQRDREPLRQGAGRRGVKHVIDLLTKFVEEKAQDFDALDKDEQEELLQLFRTAPGDFKNLLLGNYGKLPVGWPADWVYQSAFGDEWSARIKERKEMSPLDSMPKDDLDRIRKDLSENVGREVTDEEFILYLMHPKDALEFIEFRDKFGEAPLVLPTDVWREGLTKPGDRVDFELWGKPYSIELVSIGAEHEGVVHVVMRVNNKTRVYTVIRRGPRRPRSGWPGEQATSARRSTATSGGSATPSADPIKAGDIVHKGEEIANLEAMKMENAILAPMDGQIAEVCVKLNETVQEGQLLFVIEKQ